MISDETGVVGDETFEPDYDTSEPWGEGCGVYRAPVTLTMTLP